MEPPPFSVQCHSVGYLEQPNLLFGWLHFTSYLEPPKYFHFFSNQTFGFLSLLYGMPAPSSECQHLEAWPASTLTLYQLWHIQMAGAIVQYSIDYFDGKSINKKKETEVPKLFVYYNIIRVWNRRKDFKKENNQKTKTLLPSHPIRSMSLKQLAPG